MINVILNFIVLASGNSNTFVIQGLGETKELTELVPGILNQLGPDSLASLRKLAETYHNSHGGMSGLAGAGGDDDDVPDLVEDFEAADLADAPKGTSKLEEIDE